VLQERRFERVGDDHTKSVDVRLIAATNRSLAAEVAEGRFRGDLFYRLSVVPVHVPPLRERREDILPLARQFLDNFARRLNLRVPDLSRDDEAALLAYPFPGNIRELGNLIERAVVLHRPGEPRLQLYLPDQSRQQESEELAPPIEVGPPSSVSSVIDAGKWKELERENIENALAQTGWKVSGARGAAALLGIKPSTLSYRMKTLGIVRGQAQRQRQG
jgi:transcriptional regulator with GAF, ATPase, and Fis domain